MAALPDLPDRYEVLAELGRGGFGVVLKAFDKQLRREVAIKLLLERPEGEVWERFRREAKVLAEVDHPNVLRVYEFEEQAPCPFLVTELIEGRDLKVSPPKDPLPVMLGVAEGLQAIHDAGLIHRDIKPANILLTAEGRAVLLDLGLATGEELQALTATGMVVGTPAFMAPELLLGEKAETASDWYSWGQTLERLYESREVPTAVSRLVDICCHHDPRERPSSLAALRKLLESGVPAPPMAPVGIATPVRPAQGPWPWPRRVALLLGLVGIGMMMGGRPAPPGQPREPTREAGAESLGPLGSALDATLQGELDAAFLVEVEVPSETKKHHGQSFVDALSMRGIGALDALPRHVEVIRWFASGGEVGTLKAHEIAALRKYDESLNEVGGPPAFGPFLDATDRVAPPGADEPVGPVRDLLEIPAQAFKPEGRGWAWAARGHLAIAWRERERVIAEIARLEVGTSPLVAMAEDGRRPGEAQALKMRFSPDQRETLRELLAPGREAVRAYLIAARRAMDAAHYAYSSDLHKAYKRGFNAVTILLTGRMVSASRDRLFGSRARSVTAAGFEAMILKEMRVLRGRALVPEGHLAGEELAARRRALDAAMGTDDLRLQANQAARIIARLDAAGKVEEAAELYEEFREAFPSASSIQKSSLRRIVRRLGFPPFE